MLINPPVQPESQWRSLHFNNCPPQPSRFIEFYNHQWSFLLTNKQLLLSDQGFGNQLQGHCFIFALGMGVIFFWGEGVIFFFHSPFNTLLVNYGNEGKYHKETKQDTFNFWMTNTNQKNMCMWNFNNLTDPLTILSNSSMTTATPWYPRRRTIHLKCGNPTNAVYKPFTVPYAIFNACENHNAMYRLSHKSIIYGMMDIHT